MLLETHYSKKRTPPSEYEHAVHVDEPFIYECDPQAMDDLCEQSEDKPLNLAFAQSDITHGNFSDTTEHVHLSHSDIGLDPILQPDNACMTLGKYNRHGFRTCDLFDQHFLDPGSSGHTRRVSMTDKVSISDDEYTMHDDVSLMDKDHSFLSVGQSGHSCLPAGQVDHDFPSLDNSDNMDMTVGRYDRRYVPYVTFRHGFLSVSTDLGSDALIFDATEHCSRPIRATNLEKKYK